jgi:hypothetical protein
LGNGFARAYAIARMSNRVHIVKTDTVPIDTTDVVFQESVEIAKLVSLNIQGDSTADYALDVSPEGDNFFNGEANLSGTDIRATFQLTDRVIRVRVTSAGNSGDEAKITLQGVR